MRHRTGARRWALRLAVGAVLAGAGGLALAWWSARAVAPDAFYTASADAPRVPGTLLRAEPFARALPDRARAWQLLYATTRADGTPAVASALVLAPAAPATAPRPVIAWAHGTTGIVPGCAPSLQARPFDGIPALADLLAAGWAVVVPDYAGLGPPGPHGYLVGADEAQAVLDAVRAVRRLDGVTLAARTVVWGHSQGGHAALWTGLAAQRYAPDVALAGVAALAPVSDLPAFVASTRTLRFGKIIAAYLTQAYAESYPHDDIMAAVVAWARPLVRDIASRCLDGFGARVSLHEARALPPDGIFAGDPRAGALGARLAENTPRDPIPAPLLIAQATDDAIVLPAMQDSYVAALCARGQAIDYRIYAGRDHLSMLAPDSPLIVDLMAWTRDRLADVPAATTCRS